MAKTLFIIPCCSSKLKTHINANFSERKFEDYISIENRNRLNDLRGQISEIKTNSEIEINNGIELLPAYLRYTGNLYKAAGEDIWSIVSQNSNIEVAIISAYFGLLLYDEAIPIYNLSMDNCMNCNGHKIRISRFWNSNNLKKLLYDFIYRNDFQIIYNLLSQNYRKSLASFDSFFEYNSDYHIISYSDGRMRKQGRFLREKVFEIAAK